MSKQRPSASSPTARNAADHLPAAHWRHRIFKNSYTRQGRSIRLDRWSVKIQRQGRRCTFTLSARTKTAAASEAKAIYDTIVAEGWEAATRNHQSWSRGEAAFPKSDVRYWRERLLHRRYRFPASAQSDDHFAVQIEHAGTGYFFPLGTPDADKAAAKAHAIYWKVVQRGWDSVCRNYPRELVVGFEWSVNPLMWTYTTIHTLVGHPLNGNGSKPASTSPSQRVLLMEPDAGIRAALSWCIEQHRGFCAVAGDSVRPLEAAIDLHKPFMMLVNRNLGARLGFASPAQVAPVREGVPVLMYSVCPDGDTLFTSTPGGSQGYFLKRVAPERILEPSMEVASRSALSTDALLSRVKSHFKELLRSRADEDASGLSKLTRREREVLVLLSRGCVDKEIAQALGISIWTVHGHIKNIFERLQVRTRTEAVVRYLEK
jgi:DNA-binding NarL/FixJ family response regulator